MHVGHRNAFWTETVQLNSACLGRPVHFDCYLNNRQADPSQMSLLLINDGQDLPTMNFEAIFKDCSHAYQLAPMLCVGIHCGPDRKNEYGMIHSADYLGRGARASHYRDFVFQELVPYLVANYQADRFRQRAFAGFSLGGLSALDLTWNYPHWFSRTGVFSGSLWWRSVDKHDRHYNETTCRLMHQQIRRGIHHPGLKFFFECGELDETEDRNHNGVIDSIDDTIDLLRELQAKGYTEGKDFYYLQLPEGRHDVATWGKAFPAFLKWGWGSM